MAKLVSILYSSIKSAASAGYSGAASAFQFYIVRLKVQFPVDCGHLVRVSILYSSIKRKNDTRIAVLGDRVSILYSSIKSAPSRRNNSARSVSILYSSIKRISNVFMFSKNLRVSILYSSIKRNLRITAHHGLRLFQFYIVRLKGHIAANADYNLMFQFYIVRLKELVYLVYYCNLPVSILYSSIKSRLKIKRI